MHNQIIFKNYLIILCQTILIFPIEVVKEMLVMFLTSFKVVHLFLQLQYYPDVYYLIFYFAQHSKISMEIPGGEQVLRSTVLRQFKSKKSSSTTFNSCDLRLGFSLTWEQQLSKIKLVEEKKKKD
jgi:hypothetical protein